MDESTLRRLEVVQFGVGELSLFHRNPRRGDVAVCRPGAPIYVAHSDVLRIPLQSEPIAEGVVGDAAPRDFEPIVYGFTADGSGRLGRGGDHWHGDNRSSTVFDIARPSRSAVHPTMKPVELVEAMLKNSCAPGAWVIDGFGGSGSTLIAAHRLGRKAFLVELDPTYADVICRRFQEHTGMTPVREGVPVDFTGVPDAGA